MAKSSKKTIQIEFPEEVKAELEGSNITVTGPKGSLTRTLEYPGVTISTKDGKIEVTTNASKKVFTAIRGTFAAHLKNMMNGVTNGFEYKLKVMHSHFPMTVKQQGNVISIDNFLGEKTPRKSKVVGDCSISIKGSDIEITGVNIEEVAQTAANIELATKVKGRDRRVFQDGIYLISKGVASSEH
jgi:large subunit ribosomal protein L6